MDLYEQMRCNGMDPSLFNLAVSESELGKQIGNSMSQNVIERILHSLLPAAGLVEDIGMDRWKSGEAIAALEASRDRMFKNQLGPINDEHQYQPWCEPGELHLWNAIPIHKLYRLPNCFG